MYTLSMICRETGEGGIKICSEKELNVLTSDIPKRVNSSKTFTRYDEFAETLWITTITKIDNK